MVYKTFLLSFLLLSQHPARVAQENGGAVSASAVYFFSYDGSFLELSRKSLEVHRIWRLQDIKGLGDLVSNSRNGPPVVSLAFWEGDLQRLFVLLAGDNDGEQDPTWSYVLAAVRLPDFLVTDRVKLSLTSESAPRLILSADAKTLFLTYSSFPLSSPGSDRVLSTFLEARSVLNLEQGGLYSSVIRNPSWSPDAIEPVPTFEATAHVVPSASYIVSGNQTISFLDGRLIAAPFKFDDGLSASSLLKKRNYERPTKELAGKAAVYEMVADSKVGKVLVRLYPRDGTGTMGLFVYDVASKKAGDIIDTPLGDAHLTVDGKTIVVVENGPRDEKARDKWPQGWVTTGHILLYDSRSGGLRKNLYSTEFSGRLGTAKVICEDSEEGRIFLKTPADRLAALDIQSGTTMILKTDFYPGGQFGCVFSEAGRLSL